MVSPGAYPLLAAGDGPQGAPFKGIDGEYVSLATVAHRKSAGWGNLNELELLNSTSGGGSMEGTSLSSTACMTFPSGTQSMDGTEGHVGAFFLASNERAESIPTRHLMNFKGFMDISSQMGSMVIVNPSVVVMGQDDCPVSNNGELRQHYMDLSTSPPSFVSQPHTLGHLYNSVLGTHANLAQPMVLNKFGTNTWASGNELPFLPISDTARVMQPLAARPACMEPGQQQTSPGISLLMPRPHQLLRDEQGSMLQHGSVSALTIDDTGVSPRSNQGLSLSLSACQNPAQMQRYEVGGLSNYQGVMEGGAMEGRRRDEGYLQKWLGSSDQWRTQSHGSGYQEAGLQSRDNSKLQMEASMQAVPSFCGFLNGSKYLKAAQLILEEVASLGSVMKRCSSSQKVLRSLMVGGGSLLEHALKGESLAVETINGGQKVVASAISLPNIAGGLEQRSVIIEPSLQENHDLQLKKAKLVAMLDEVDRRYKLYFSQMEAIVHTFESAAGLGAAKTYTALALQTISKHFRSLRDAIGGQIQAASRALGDDPSSMGLGRLRYVDQQWRAQAALQQLGMVQQHAWRPQRGLPERAVSVLRAWLFEHFLHPYPKDADKHLLAQQTGLTRNQVSNWFINARVRLWKPMVEEMYIEEMKEAQLDRKASAKTFRDHNHILEASDNHRSGISSMDDLSGTGILDSSNKQGQRDEVGGKDTDTTPTNKQSGSNMQQHAAALDSGDGLLLRGLGALSSYEQGFRPEEGERKEEFEGQDKHSFAIGRMEEHHALGSYHGEAGEFATMQAGYRDISLTLGLQHSDYLSLTQAQQQSYQYYLQQDQQQQHHILGDGGNSGHTLTGSRRRLGELEDYDQSIDSTKNYEAVAELQTRKRFAYNAFNYG